MAGVGKDSLFFKGLATASVTMSREHKGNPDWTWYVFFLLFSFGGRSQGWEGWTWEDWEVGVMGCMM